MDKTKVLENLASRKKMFEDYLRQLKASAAKRQDTRKASNK